MPDSITRFETKRISLFDIIEIIENTYLKYCRKHQFCENISVAKNVRCFGNWPILNIISKILNEEFTSMDDLPEDLKANELLFF